MTITVFIKPNLQIYNIRTPLKQVEGNSLELTSRSFRPSIFDYFITPLPEIYKIFPKSADFKQIISRIFPDDIFNSSLAINDRKCKENETRRY